MKLIFVLLVVIILRITFYQTPYNEGDKLKITGRVDRETIVYDRTQQIHIAGLVMYIPKYPEVEYGDKVSVVGIYKDGKLDDAELISVAKSESLLYQFRKSVISFYKNSLPEPHASLVAGVTFGSKAGMPESFWEKLKTSGTAHVVVASGMNVTLVGGFLMSVLVNFVNRKKALVGIVVGIWVYAIAAGFDAPIIRAATMGSIAFSAQALGRLNNAFRALMLSAGLMILWNPLWLHDVGFQLSFGATLSLILFNAKVERLIHFVPPLLRQDLATSLAAQIGVAPLLVVYFGTVNLLSPIINAFVLWTIPLLTIIGMVAGVVGIIVPIIGKLLLMVVYPLTSWFLFIVNLFS